MQTTDIASSSSAAAPVELSVPRDDAARREWLKTGEMPKAAESAPAKVDATATEESSTSTSESAAASETATTQEQKERQKKGNPSKARLDEILEDLKNAGLSPAELKTFKKQAAQATETKTAEPSPAKPAQPQLVQPTRPKPTQDEKKPDGTAKFATYEDFIEDLTDWKTEQKLAEQERTQQQRAHQSAIQERISEGRKRYADFDSVAQPALQAIVQDKQIANEVKELIGVSPVLPDLLYVMGGKQADLQDFLQTARTDRIAAIRKVVLLEQLVIEELKGKGGEGAAGAGKPSGTSPRDPNTGQFQKAPEKKVTDAPAPPHEVGSRSTPPADEVESALKNDDFTAYKDAENRRALQKRKG